MLYTGNPYVIQPGNVFFMHMILMDSDNELAMNLGETYLVNENGNERLEKQKFLEFMEHGVEQTHQTINWW